jgi:hypothetical protein
MRQIAAVKLHAFDHLERRLHGLRFFHGDDPVLAHFFHRLGDDPADVFIVVGADRADLNDHVAFNILVLFLDLLYGNFHRLLDAPLQGHRVCPSR